MSGGRSQRPEYIIFAGVNGVGKSTFYRTFIWTENARSRKMPRINSDELVRAASGDWRSEEDQAKAAKEAVRKIRLLMRAGHSFNQETTLSGHSAIRRIRDASDLGYRVRMFYIGIDSPEMAQSRISQREKVGGHGIPEEVVQRRYIESLRNLSKALRMCDEVVVLDNTIEFIEIARWAQGILTWVGNVRQRGQWLIEAMQNEEVWDAGA